MQRQDYILRLIEELGVFTSEILRHREGGRVSEALVVLVQAQEKLFGRPLVSFASEPLERQLEHLTTGETRSSGHEKILLYADLLEQAGTLYRLRGDEQLAQHAFGAALHVLLLAKTAYPDMDAGRCLTRIDALLGQLDLPHLHAPTQELLAEALKKADSIHPFDR